MSVVIFPADGSAAFLKDGSGKDGNKKWIKLIEAGEEADYAKSREGQGMFIQVVQLTPEIVAYVDEEGMYTSKQNPKYPVLFGAIVVAKGTLTPEGEHVVEDVTIKYIYVYGSDPYTYIYFIQVISNVV